MPSYTCFPTRGFKSHLVRRWTMNGHKRHRRYEGIPGALSARRGVDSRAQGDARRKARGSSSRLPNSRPAWTTSIGSKASTMTCWRAAPSISATCCPKSREHGPPKTQFPIRAIRSSWRAHHGFLSFLELRLDDHKPALASFEKGYAFRNRTVIIFAIGRLETSQSDGWKLRNRTVVIFAIGRLLKKRGP